MNYPVTLPEQTTRATGPDDGYMLALLRAAGCIQEKLEAELESVGLSPAKYQALDALVRADQPLALSELAGCLKCVRSNITQLTDRLESDGLVKRVDDPSDRRAIRAVVTPLGVERHATGAKVIRDLQTTLAARVAPADRKVLLRVLSALR